ncbi:MAG: S41 family peptidase [Prevotella sp.]|nr:S41 family peptidase [Prevotella sp.]
MRKLLSCILLSVLGLAPVHAQRKDHNFDVAKNLEVLNTIYKQLDMMYVDTLDANEVLGTGIEAMLRSLDPYTVYYPEDKVRDLKSMITGNMGAGIGSLIRYNSQIRNVVIDEPYAGMPAAEAGLKKGDIVLSVDDEPMAGKDNEYVSKRLRGDAGTSFILKVKRPSTGKILKMKITRRAIVMPAVPYYGMQKDGIGYINLNSFTEGCAKEVRRAFVELRNQGMKGLVLDLRGNGGGSEQEAVSIVNMFVPKGRLIVSNRGKLARVNRDYRATVEPVDTLMPIVVMVNGGTASSSEITSGALQDLDRAVILGTRTYGKGLVQMTMDVPYNGQLKLTTNKYYIPSGRCIQAINYRHARGGYTEHVADSLTKVFYTSRGREVRDGGGIQPDVEVKPDSLPNIAYYLSEVKDSNEVLLNYETDYIARHPTIAPPSEFELSDADYEEFKQRVVKSGFKYDPESEKGLEKLITIARFEGYYDEAKAEFEALEQKLKHNVAKDLDYNKEMIKQVIENDLVAAYYFQRGTVENMLRKDKQFKAAMELIGDSARYQQLLQPVKKGK